LTSPFPHDPPCLSPATFIFFPPFPYAMKVEVLIPFSPLSTLNSFPSWEAIVLRVWFAPSPEFPSYFFFFPFRDAFPLPPVFFFGPGARRRYFSTSDLTFLYCGMCSETPPPFVFERCSALACSMMSAIFFPISPALVRMAFLPSSPINPLFFFHRIRSWFPLFQTPFPTFFLVR